MRENRHSLEGMTAPRFAARDVNGKKFVIGEYRDHRSVVLVFLRYVGCPLCQVALQQYKSAFPDFAARDAELAIVVQSPRSSILESGDAGGMPFRLIPDPNGSIFQQYGVGAAHLLAAPRSISIAFASVLKGYKPGKREGDALQLPAGFVIDRAGIVRYELLGKHPADNPLPEQLLSQL